jgi:phosphoadenosine phosphosulfate reductase
VTTTPVEGRRSTEELRAVAEEGRRTFADATGVEGAEAVSAWAAEQFEGSLAVACSMQDAVLPHLVSRFAPGVDVLFLETGYHFAETIGTRDAVAHTLPVTVVDVLPRRTVAEQDAEHGPRLHDRDPALCCRLRKMQPLAEQLQGYEAWVTGVRREEAPTRAATPVVGWDERHGLVKVNPLAAWSLDELLDYAQVHQVLLNPLLTNGYPSIGCAPCTRAVASGDDPRSGRWAGLAKTECGIHV